MPSGTRPSPVTRQTKLTYHGTFEDALWTNVMWLYLTGSGEITVSELNDLAAACSGAFADELLPQGSNDMSLDETKVVLYASGGDVFEGIAGAGGVGTRSDQNMPASVAAVISWNIGPHYRGGHPRTYFSGLTAGVIDSPTTLAGTYVTALDSAANSFHAALEAISGISDGISTVEHGVVSFVRDKAWRTPPVFYRIASGSVDNRIDSQRRRLGRDR